MGWFRSSFHERSHCSFKFRLHFFRILTSGLEQCVKEFSLWVFYFLKRKAWTLGWKIGIVAFKVNARHFYHSEQQQTKWFQTNCRPKQGCATVTRSSAMHKKFFQSNAKNVGHHKKRKEDELEWSFANCRLWTAVKIVFAILLLAFLRDFLAFKMPLAFSGQNNHSIISP